LRGWLDLAVEFHVKDAHNLEFTDNTFDGCRAKRTFQHLQSPQKALSEMVRVTRPGGRVIVNEPDWETMVIDSPYKDVTRKILNFFCDTLIRNGWIGRQLLGMFKSIGLVDTVVVPLTGIRTDFEQADRSFELRKSAALAHEQGLISVADVTNWISHLEKASRGGQFFLAGMSIMVCGTKPL
jgi:ubiquinone/menaquinone biosynthesis C-methylase UbiE